MCRATAPVPGNYRRILTEMGRPAFLHPKADGVCSVNPIVAGQVRNEWFCPDIIQFDSIQYIWQETTLSGANIENRIDLRAVSSMADHF